MLAAADHKAVLLFMLLSFCMSFFRALRYRILLKISGYAPGLPALYLAVLVGNLCSDLLPARFGTLSYVLVTKRLGVPLAAGAASFAISFLFDLLTLGPVVAITVIAVGGGTGVPILVLLASGALVTILTLLLIAHLPGLCRVAGRCVSGITFLPPMARLKIGRLFASVQNEIRVTQSAGVYFHLFMVSMAARITKYFALFVFLYALLKPLGYRLPDLSVARVFLGATAAECAASLPFSGLAGFGIYEGTWSVVFHLLGFPEHIAKLTGVSHHAFVQFYGYALGLLALIILALPIFKRGRIMDIHVHKCYIPQTGQTI